MMILCGVRKDDEQVSARSPTEMDGPPRTLEEVFVNDTPVLLGNKHAGLNEFLRRELPARIDVNTRVHEIG